jgi:D-cysteine desulfhydrase
MNRTARAEGIAAVADGDITPGRRTVFLHTGGLPGLFGHSDALEATAADPASRSLTP